MGSLRSAQDVAKWLIRATVVPTRSASEEFEVKGASGKVMLRYSRSARGGLTLRVSPKSGVPIDELLSAIQVVLEEGRGP